MIQYCTFVVGAPKVEGTTKYVPSITKVNGVEKKAWSRYVFTGNAWAFQGSAILSKKATRDDVVGAFNH